MDDEQILYTFKQPVRGGYYYIVVRADSREEAAQVTADVAGSLKHLTERIEHLSQYMEGELALSDRMQKRLDEMGWAHRFVPVPARLYHERTEHRGFIPE